MTLNRFEKINQIILQIKEDILSASDISQVSSIIEKINNLEVMVSLCNENIEESFILTTSSDNKSHRKLYPKDVYMINSDGRFTTFETIDGNTYFYPRISLKKIMNDWSGHFIFGGRDKLLNISLINKVYVLNGKNYVRLNINSIIIEISRRSAKEIKSLFDKGSI